MIEVSEGGELLMAETAGYGTVAGQAGIVEQPSAQSHSLYSKRVLGHVVYRLRKVWRQVERIRLRARLYIRSASAAPYEQEQTGCVYQVSCHRSVTSVMRNMLR